MRHKLFYNIWVQVVDNWDGSHDLWCLHPIGRRQKEERNKKMFDSLEAKKIPGEKKRCLAVSPTDILSTALIP
jgi:hypothetical protein